MTFLDTSFYVAVINPHDALHDKALKLSERLEDLQMMTSYAVLGEVLTVVSMRYNRQAAIDFVSDILKSKTKIILEDEAMLEKTFSVFKTVKDKDIGWVDCYSFAIAERYKVDKIVSFDRAFKQYTKAEVLS